MNTLLLVLIIACNICTALADDDACEVTVTDVAALTLALDNTTTCPNKKITFMRSAGSPPAPRLAASLVVRSNIVLVCSGEGAPHFTCPASAPCIASNAFVDLEVRGCALYGGAGIHVNGSRSLSLRNVTVDKCRYARTTRPPPIWHTSGDPSTSSFSVSHFSCVFVENTTSLEIVDSTLSDGLQIASTYVVDGLTVSSTTARGGCLSVVRTGRVDIIRSNITNCTVATMTGCGGCISLRQVGNVNINDTDISGCSATFSNDLSTFVTNGGYSGGGGMNVADIGKMLIHRSTIRNAISKVGGCMFLFHSDVTISDSLLTNCTARSGGGMEVVRCANDGSGALIGKMLFHRSTIRGAISKEEGGCMSIARSDVTISDSLLANCTALAGGGIHVVRSPKLQVTNSTIWSPIQMEKASLTMSNTIMRSQDSGPCLLLNEGMSRVESSDFSTCSVAFLSIDADVSYVPSATDKTTWAVYDTSWDVTALSRMGMMIRQPMRDSQSYGACMGYLEDQNVSQSSNGKSVLNDDGYTLCRSRSSTTTLCPLLNGSVPLNRTLTAARLPNRTLLQGPMSDGDRDYQLCAYLDIFDDDDAIFTNDHEPKGFTSVSRQLSSALTGLTVASAMISNPYLGGDMSAVHRLQLCKEEHLTELDFGSHPTGITIDSDPYLGALVANTVIVAIAWGMYLVSALPFFFRAMGPRTHAMLLHGVITPALWFSFDGGGPYMPLGILVLLAYVATAAVFFYRMPRPFCATMGIVADPDIDNVSTLGLLRWFTWRNGEWKSDPPEFAKTYGTLFSDYRSERVWVCVVDWVLSFALSVILSFRKAKCETLATASLVVTILHFMCVVALRPHHTTRDFICAVLVTGSQTALVGLTLAPSSEAVAAGNAIFAAVVSACSFWRLTRSITQFFLQRCLIAKPTVSETEMQTTLGSSLIDNHEKPQPTVPDKPSPKASTPATPDPNGSTASPAPVSELVKTEGEISRQRVFSI